MVSPITPEETHHAQVTRRDRGDALAAGITLAGALGEATSAQLLICTITNYDNDGTHGVYLRHAADINIVTRDTALYATYGTPVQLNCYAWRSSVGGYANRVCRYVTVLGGNNVGHARWVSDYWVNCPVRANQIVPGGLFCGSTTAVLTSATTIKTPRTSGYTKLELCPGAVLRTRR